MAEPLLDDARLAGLRSRMVATQVEPRGVKDLAVLAALRAVPRHAFFPEARRHLAYEDGAFSIGEGQTISQPYIVGYMTALIVPNPDMKVLEIGTGSGYQTAILSHCVGEVNTIENHPNLARKAEARLAATGITNVHFRIGDGFDGWADRAPFDAILLTAATCEFLSRSSISGNSVAPIDIMVRSRVRIMPDTTGMS